MISDFGLSKSIEIYSSYLLQEGIELTTLVGTQEYLAPEIKMNKKI